ncbi:MAG: DUF951 domain-containing protein [Ruminococcus sp.]|nr:DUF951 domain-containing protein [Ruminococcus sp.]
MNIKAGDTLKMKKPHPCGGSEMLVLRSGMDFKLRCVKCGHEIMAARGKIEKNVKALLPSDNREDSL